MIDKSLLRQSVEKAIEGSDIFIVDITVSPDNNIVVDLDSMEPLDIDTCAKITRAIEADFDREAEDYQLEVGSAGLTSPFKVKQQYVKNWATRSRCSPATAANSRAPSSRPTMKTSRWKCPPK